MNIRPLAVAAFVLVLVLAGCLAPTPSIPTPTPVPIATWVAQGIPSDLIITYDMVIPLVDIQEAIRITADGSATYRRSNPRVTEQFQGKLSPEALKRVMLAFEEKRFFHLTLACDCVADTSSPLLACSGVEHVTEQPVTTVAIRINGLSKELERNEGSVCSGAIYRSGKENFMSLVGILRDAVLDLPPVTPTSTGAVVPSPTATPTGVGG
jgi:hypothetical protein